MRFNRSWCRFLTFTVAALCAANAWVASEPQTFAADGQKKVVFVAGKPSHAYAAHEHNAGCLLLAKELAAAMPSYSCSTHHYGWPEDAQFFAGADCLVMYCDGGAGHMVNQHLDQVDALAKKGLGIVCIHYGVEVPKGPDAGTIPARAKGGQSSWNRIGMPPGE